MKSKFSSFLHKTWFQSAKRKGFTLMEILVASAIIIALSVGAFFAYQMNQDMEAIAKAALSYESISLTSTPPDSIEAMISPGLSETDSIDGSAHTFLTYLKGKGDATVEVKDPWGTKYGYDKSARTITCTPKAADGTTDLPTVTRHF